MENEQKLSIIFEELKPLTHEFMVHMFDELDKKNIADGEKSYMYMCLLSYMVKSFMQGSVAPENIEEALEDFVDTIHAQIVLEQGEGMTSLEELIKEQGLN